MKSTKSITPLMRFYRLLMQYKNQIRQIHLYALFIGIVNLTLPLGIQAIVNFLQIGEFTSTWFILVLFVLGGIGITGIFQVMQLRIVENIQQDLFLRSAFEFAYRLPKITFIKLDKIHAPELANRFFDTLTIQKGLPKILIDFSVAIFQIIFGIVLLSIYSFYFVLLGIVLALILWVIFQFTGPRGLKTSLKESKYKYKIAHWLEEIARVNRSFKLYARNRFHLHRTDDYVGSYLEAREGHFGVLLSQFRLFIGFKIVVAAGLLLLGGYLVFAERMNIGQFVAAEIIVILIINSVEKVLRTIDTVYDVLTALEKIGYVTDLQLDKDTGTVILTPQTGLKVEAREIEFGFPDEKRKIFSDLSFKILPNEKVVLDGDSGSGKTLLLQILAGIHEVQDGQILVDDVPFDNYDRDQLYKNYSVSFPTNQIFEGSLRENILMGRTIPEEQLTEILDELNLTPYIIHQPQGIDSHVDSGGRRLPRSVIQKLLVARMLIDNPKLLLMEDPLHFIDIEEKKKIVDFIMSPDRPWTVVVVSDFYYWKEKSDRVMTLTQNLP